MKNQRVLKKVCNNFGSICVVIITAASMVATSGCPIMDETRRDDKGVWFIEGPETEDLYNVFERMGYAVATDRLWQLEIFKRVARGRLSEILGSDLLVDDIWLRTRNYSEQELQEGFDALDTESKDTINGYVAGFNRRIAEVRENTLLLPIEFTLIGLLQGSRFLPEDWTPLDILAWLVRFQRDFDPEASSVDQVDNAALYNDLMEKFPNDFQDMFHDLRWVNDPDELTYIGESATTASALMGVVEKWSVEGKKQDMPDLRQASKNMNRIYNNVLGSRKEINGYVKLGSYAWVVSGDKTASGNPIIYSGPQMALKFDAPSVMQEGSIRAGGLNVSGMSIPGIPGIVIGRTPHHAWSFQVGHGHSVDFYLEDPSDVFLHRTETIRIAGEDDFELKIYRTSHGPVVYPELYDPLTYIPDPENPIIAWKYSHWGYELNVIRALLEMARANNMDEFEEGLELVGVSMHVCYADREGNIAYWMTGRDPKRPDGEWRFPQGFTGPPLEWDAERLRQRSTDRNTGRGFYSGWNNKTNPDYPSGFNNYGNMFGPFMRAHVMHDYLISHDNLSFEDVRDLALNIATTDSFGFGGNPWKFVKDYFSAAVHANSTEEREDGLAILEEWDGHFVAGGEAKWVSGTDRADAWILMDAWIREVIRLTFEDELETIPVIWGEYLQWQIALLFDVSLHGLSGESSGLVNNYKWFQNLSNPNAPQTANDIIVEALDNVLEILGSRPWGKNERGVLEHKHMIFQTVHTTPFASRSNYAQCVEFDSSGPVRIESLFHMGESGNIFSPHFWSMNKLFDSFEHRPFPLFD
jgi:penicillin amidase